MTRDQVMKYLGRPWTEKEDCYHWFREIQSREFDRNLPMVPGEHTVFRAARIIEKVAAALNGVRTDSPQEGDAVFMTQRKRSHHVGTLVHVDGQRYVLHAVEGSGVILSTESSLMANGWRIDGYWTDRPT